MKLRHGDSKLPQLIVPAGYSAHQGSAGRTLRQLTHAEQMDGTKTSSAHRGWHRLVGSVPTLKADAELSGPKAYGLTLLPCRVGRPFHGPGRLAHGVTYRDR